MAVVHSLIGWFLGRRWYANILAVAALVTLPVVYGGAAITWIVDALSVTTGSGAAAGIHYTQLCIRMLTVVPLALALVAVIPFGRMERNLLLRTGGITPLQKKQLMALRVFNHTAFFVLPSLMEILREEHYRPFRHRAGRARTWRRFIHFIIHLAVESICAAVQYIPLWAWEIAQLPEPRAGSEEDGSRD